MNSGDIQVVRPARPTRSTDEIVSLGTEIYERDIRRQVEGDHDGDIVAIDVETGLWAVDVEVIEAVERLRAKRPEAVNVYFERVGYVAVDSLGGALLRRVD